MFLRGVTYSIIIPQLLWKLTIVTLFMYPEVELVSFARKNIDNVTSSNMVTTLLTNSLIFKGPSIV